MVVLSKLASVVTFSVLLANVFGSPVPSPDPDASNILEARQNNFFAVTGVSGSVQSRLEIRSLQQDATSWNLFLLAMQSFMAVDQRTRESYFQISGKELTPIPGGACLIWQLGIHGQPTVVWDGVRGQGNTGNVVGYCPHGSNRQFPVSPSP